MSVLVRVDNITYSLLAKILELSDGLYYDPSAILSSNLTNTVISPTQTQLTTQAGHMQFKLTFLNPIEVRTQVVLYFVNQYSQFPCSLTIGSNNQSRSHTCH